MICPKCGGEIPFYDLKPNCRHCGVNILYYTQEEGLIRDAKRTELESASARMIIARIKAAFIGGKLQIARMIFTIGAVCALMLPFGGAHYVVPFFDGKLSIGLIGLIQSFGNGMLLKTPQLLQSALLSKATLAAAVLAGFFLVITVIDLLIFAAFLLGFLNLTKSTTFMKRCALIGAVVSALAQVAAIVLKSALPSSDAAAVVLGFGGLLSCAVLLVVFFLNRALLKNGIEPTYSENDIKRKELLKKVRAGEVDLDSLPLPIFESEEEHEERMKALEEALKAEEEGKEL
ncbi:MAG: hypothetical protein IKD72_08615 [Clostridia bacterium]|nr:hypothetical protein [Clostridia bacterium]